MTTRTDAAKRVSERSADRTRRLWQLSYDPSGMRKLRVVVYWLAVVMVSAILAYLLLQFAEGLDASQVDAAALMTLQSSYRS